MNRFEIEGGNRAQKCGDFLTRHSFLTAVMVTLSMLSGVPALAQDSKAQVSPMNQMDFVTHLNAGVQLAKSGKSLEGIEEMKKAAEIKPDDPLILMNLGQAYQVCGKNLEALEQYKKYLSLYPKGQYVPQITTMFKVMQSQVMMTGGQSSKGMDNYLNEALAPGGGRWNSAQMPIKIYIADGKNVQGFQENFPTILKTALNDWCEATKGKVSVAFVDNASKANITCRWIDNVKLLANPAEGGQALVRLGPNHVIIGVDILLLCSGPNVPTNISADNYMRHICLHEVGHAFGMSGHSSQPGDIMFSVMNYDSNEKNLSERDKKTISDLYSLKNALSGLPPVSPMVIESSPGGK